MPTEALGPMRLDPYLSRPLWGGRLLATEYGRGDDLEAAIGESWEVFAGDRITSGPLAGQTLQDATTSLGERLLGRDGARHAAGHFPLLIKLIDAGQQLSIQVHPNDAQAKQMEGQPFGKTEAWYILRAEPGARLIYGVKRALSRGELVDRAKSGEIEQDLAYVDVSPGDSVLVPAGTIHAIGAGIVLYEVQETSDTTYRLYDWKRTGPDGKQRELHLDQAAKVAKLEPSAGGVQQQRATQEDGVADSVVVRCPYFVLERLDLTAPAERDPAGRSFEAVTVIGGSARIESLADAWQPEMLADGQSLLIPADAGPYQIVQDSQTPATALIAAVPPA